MQRSTITIVIPTLVRTKPGALERLGIYLRRHQCSRIGLCLSAGLPAFVTTRLLQALEAENIEVVRGYTVADNELDPWLESFRRLDTSLQAVVGVGGGMALDGAKYLAFLCGLPYFAVPTALSNDAFCSPSCSLAIHGQRRSLPAALPYGLIIDTDICSQAPQGLWLSGVGDLMAKFTAVQDWKLAFHNQGEPVNDFACLLSDATVHQFLAHPYQDQKGTRILATALMLNGIAMAISGSSRPASGSEHLISHALDRIASRSRPHGWQVGVASYLVSLLQGQYSQSIDKLFQRTGFWDAVAAAPFVLAEWEHAIELAVTIKPGFYTVLSEADNRRQALKLLQQDPRLRRCLR